MLSIISDSWVAGATPQNQARLQCEPCRGLNAGGYDSTLSVQIKEDLTTATKASTTNKSKCRRI